MRNTATALAAILVAFMFTGCTSEPERRETARTAATPEVAVNSCRQSGRTTMVRGDCLVDWDGQTVRVSGTCDVTPGMSSQGSCLRLQINAAPGGCIVSPQASLSPWASLERPLQCEAIDAALLKNGTLHVQNERSCKVLVSRGSIGDGSVICR